MGHSWWDKAWNFADCPHGPALGPASLHVADNKGVVDAAAHAGRMDSPLTQASFPAGDSPSPRGEKLSPRTPAGMSPENSHRRVDRSASPGNRTLGRRSVCSALHSPGSVASSGFTFGHKTIGIWSSANGRNIVMRRGVILHSTTVNHRCVEDVPGPGACSLPPATRNCFSLGRPVAGH